MGRNPHFAIELAAAALQDADVAGDVRGARAVADLDTLGRAREPARVLVIEQREYRVAAIEVLLSGDVQKRIETKGT